MLGGNDRDGYGVGDCQGQVRSLPGGHNLFGNSSGCGFDGAGAPGNIVGTAAAPADPQLGPLKINGGQTPTVALPATSPAAGGGDPAVCAAAPVDGFDQRAFTRPSGACDIGAFDHLARNVPPGG